MLGIMFHQARSPPPRWGRVRLPAVGRSRSESPPTKGGEDSLLVILVIKGAIFN